MPHVTGTPAQAPRPIPDILQTAARIYREQAFEFYGIAATTLLVSWTINLCIKVWTIGGMPLGALQDPRAPEFFRTIAQWLGARVANDMIYALFNIIPGAIVTVMVAARQDGRRLDVADGVRAAAGRLGPLARATLLYFLVMAVLIGLGGVAVGIPAVGGVMTGMTGGLAALALGALAALAALGVALAFGAGILYLMLRWALYTQVAVLEKVSAMDALRRSVRITRDRPGTRPTDRYLFRAAALMLALVFLEIVAGTIGAVPEYGAGLIFGGAAGSEVSIINPTGTPLYLLIPLEILSVLLSAAVFPYGVTVFSLLYLDVTRTRPGAAAIG